MNTVATKSPIAELKGFMDKFKPQLALALPAHLNADRMARLALTEFSKNIQLQQCTPMSIASSVMLAGQMGLEIGVGGQGYLIPYKNTCTFVPGWRGLQDLVNRSGRATTWTGAVMPGDRFAYQLGDSPFCTHTPGEEDDAEFTHVYAIGRVKGTEVAVIEVWTRAKVLKHLNKFNKVGGSHYAHKDENNLQMYGRKIALLQVLKYMPQSIELNNAITATHAAEKGQKVTIDGDFMTVVDDAEAANEIKAPVAKFRARDEELPTDPAGSPTKGDPRIFNADAVRVSASQAKSLHSKAAARGVNITDLFAMAGCTYHSDDRITVDQFEAVKLWDLENA